MTHKESHSESEQPLKDPARDLNAAPWMAGAVLLLGLAVVAGVYWGRTVTVQSVHFEGYHYVALQELEGKVDIPSGVRPDSLDFRSIIGRVEQIPFVKNADVSVEPSGKLVVRITERQPLAMLADGENKIYVDAEGIRLPLVLGKEVDVPILYGFKAKPMGDTLRSKAFRAARNFLIEVSRKPVSDATISEVAWTRNEGIVALTNDNGVKLIFGKEDFRSRLRNWEAFYAEVVREKGINSMRTIDLRFRRQVVSRET